MTTEILLLTILCFVCNRLASYLKEIRTGDPNESNSTYWMFSYDFKSPNKEWVPEDPSLLKKKKRRNFLVLMLYLNIFLIFLVGNSFIADLLELIN
tara:strand:+ start:287 stop:574 length:288 start_codon:yes stop_codon:yes gene_type:complete